MRLNMHEDVQVLRIWCARVSAPNLDLYPPKLLAIKQVA